MFILALIIILYQNAVLDEHASEENSAIFHHLTKCDNFKFMSSLFALPDNNHNKKTNIDTLSHLRNAVLTYFNNESSLQ